MRRAGTVRLITRMCVFRWRAALVLLLAGLIVCGSVVGLATVRTSTMDAVLGGIAGDRGYPSGWVIQSLSEEGTDALADVSGLTPVAATSTDLTTPTSLVRGDVLVQGNQRVWLQHLVSGQRPANGREVTLSRHLADSLGAGIGDTVTATLPRGKTNLRVAGLTVDPAHRRGDTAVLARRDLGGLTPNQWLTPDLSTVESNRQVDSLLRDHDLRVSSTQGAFEDARAHPPPLVNVLRFLPTGVGILLTLLALASLSALRSEATRDVSSLVGAGFSRAGAWRLVAAAAASVATVGALAGTGMVTLLLHLFKGQVSAPLGQEWLQVALPVTPLVVLVLLPGILALVARPALAAAGRVRAWLVRPRLRGTGATMAACIGIIVGLALMAYGYWQQQQTEATRAGLVALLGLLIVAGALPVPLTALARARASGASRRVVRHLGTQFVLVAMVGLVIAGATSGYAALTTHDANAIDRVTTGPQPPGSFLIQGVPEGPAHRLKSAYERLGGSDTATYQIAATARGIARATTPALAQCLAKRQNADTCFTKPPSAPLNVIGLSRAVPRTDVVAAPAVLHDRQVGVVVYSPPQRATPSRTYRAPVTTSRPGLGGNLPSLVLNPDGPVAQERGLTSSGEVLLALLDFDALSDQDKGRFRSLVGRLAPSGQVSESGTGAFSEQDRSLARAVALAGAGLSGTIVLLGGGAVVAGNRRLRATLPALGATLRTRWAIASRVFLGTTVAAILILLLTPWVVTTASSLEISGSLGRVWFVPLLAIAVSMVIPVAAFVLVPARARD